jgi:hypothetical protein
MIPIERNVIRNTLIPLSFGKQKRSADGTSRPIRRSLN